MRLAAEIDNMFSVKKSEVLSPQWLESVVTAAGVLTIALSEADELIGAMLTTVFLVGFLIQEMAKEREVPLFRKIHFRPHSNSGLLLGNLLTPMVTASALLRVDAPQVNQYVAAVLFLCAVVPVAVLLCAVKNFRLSGVSKQRFAHQLWVIPVFGLLVWSSWSEHQLLSLVALAVTAYFFLTRLLYFLPKSFTLGEVVLISEALTLLTLQAAFSLTEGVGSLLACLQVLVLGCVVIAIAIYPVATRLQTLSHGQRTSCKPSKQANIAYLKLSAYFYLCLAAAVVLVLLPWLGYLLGRGPLRWGILFVIATKTRILLFCLWVLLVMGAVGVVTLWGSSSTVVRKYFHLLAVCIYVPGILYDVHLLHLASAGTLFIFIVLEFLRIFRVWPIGDILHDAFQVFTDAQDCGVAILTHIYLLLGMALPVWLYMESPHSQFGTSLAIYSGVLSLGVGDTAASVVGSLYGKIRWPGSKKTVEGTCAAILSQLLACRLLFYLDPSLSAHPLGWSGVLWVVSLTSVLEAVTTQIDNLVLPLFMYSLLLSL
ncbi:dolichol kinase-like isoform X2 [Patiria miniata]|uniref:dolichol kinase n=1 Tax=Patiria miniata TaxID=46514 RepID=A0A914BSH4_PATMI|nr:dolichol kinase-like isoform X2 [Patiria miniata]